MHLIGWLSVCFLVEYFWSFKVFCHLGHFFRLGTSVTSRGRALGVPGQGNAGSCPLRLKVGEGPRGSNGTRSTLHRISATASATHNQTGPLWCWFPSGWARARPWPLWVSPTTSPVRLGVCPAATPTPTGVFTQRFEALFPSDGALGYTVCFTPRHLSKFIYA